jgi:branched-chain amino acid transport system ATP-binding protein
MSEAAPRQATGYALELRGVSKRFGSLEALGGIDMRVAPGERRAVLGSNGAGKTTLFNCITGDFLPSAGSIRFFGEDVTAGGCGGPIRFRCCSPG